jgi:dTDP-glucose 4,6-dehydratase
MANRLAGELDDVVERMGPLWDDLRGARIFVTGGTGFFGCWLLETLLWANDRLRLGISLVVLTRDPSLFHAKAPHLAAHSGLELQRGDVCALASAGGRFTHVIHAAVDGGPPRSFEERKQVFATSVAGTRRVLEFARASGARRLLLTSTGAVYGKQPPLLSHVPEGYHGGPDPAGVDSIGAEAKRAAEALCAVYADRQFEPAIARCFAFVGPYLPLDSKFAAGNFVRDALSGGPIRIAGDGTPYRSYLYASDLCVWLLTILLRGAPLRPYNVGSEAALTIAGLARAVAALFTPPPLIEVARQPAAGAAADRYVPSTERARHELSLEEAVPLDEALRRTVNWFRRTA